MTDSFDITRWSIIDKVRGDEPTQRREALTQLLTCYMPVLRAHLVRRKRLSPDLADELLQGFVVKNIVEGKLVERADPSAGKFRSWLLKWLDNYVRHELSRKKRETAIEDYDEGSRTTETDAFDADWGRATLTEALELMKQECIEEGKQERWEIFQKRLLLPLLSDAEPTDYDVLIRELNLGSKAQAQNHLVSAKRHFSRSLETIIGRYARSEEDIANEIVELRRVLSGSVANSAIAFQDNEHTVSPDDIANIVQAAPARLARLYEADVTTVWQRCLDTSIQDLLDQPEEFAFFAELTLRDLFHETQPSEKLLLRLKRFGSSIIQQKSGDIPVDVGLAIYLTSIAAGRVRLGKWISQASAEILRPGFDYLRETDWMDKDSLALHKQALQLADQ